MLEILGFISPLSQEINPISEYVCQQLQRTLFYRNQIRNLHVTCRPTSSIAFDHLSSLKGLSGSSLKFMNELKDLKLISFNIWLSSNKLPPESCKHLASISETKSLEYL